MGLETAATIDQLVPTNPVGATDPKSQGDDHFHVIKAALLGTFANFVGVLESSNAEIDAAVNAVAALPTIVASTHTPTITAVFNCTVTSAAHLYIRVASVVFVIGRAVVDPSSAASFGFRVTLPVASNLAAFTDLFGVAVGASQSGIPVEGNVFADTTNDSASVQYDVVASTGSSGFNYVFGYRII